MHAFVNYLSPDLHLPSLCAFPVSSCRILYRGTDVIDSGKLPLESSFCHAHPHTLASLPVCILPSHGIPSTRRRCSVLASGCASRHLLCNRREKSSQQNVTNLSQAVITSALRAQCKHSITRSKFSCKGQYFHTPVAIFITIVTKFHPVGFSKKIKHITTKGLALIQQLVATAQAVMKNSGLSRKDAQNRDQWMENESQGVNHLSHVYLGKAVKMVCMSMCVCERLRLRTAGHIMIIKPIGQTQAVSLLFIYFQLLQGISSSQLDRLRLFIKPIGQTQAVSLLFVYFQLLQGISSSQLDRLRL